MPTYSTIAPRQIMSHYDRQSYDFDLDYTDLRRISPIVLLVFESLIFAD
jgi:hypothetical protein